MSLKCGPGILRSSFRDRDWVLQGLMPVKPERDMRLTLAATKYLLVEVGLDCGIDALPTD
jgi:hypothetical protein